MAELSGLIALVTGGASGIGAATVAELIARGATVAALDKATAPGADWAEVADLTDARAVAQAVRSVADRLSRIDILINNAGIGAEGDVSANADEEWHRAFDVNVIGAARVTREALPWLRRSPSASIVNVASVAAMNGLPNRALYSATKGALLALTHAMAADHLADGIRVNAVAPGTTDTPWVGRLIDSSDNPTATRERLRKRQPLGRLVSAEEVAYDVANLASPRAASTTGTVVIVDGGLTSLRV